MIVRPVARAVSRAVRRPITGYVYDVTAPGVTIANVDTIDLRPALSGTVEDPAAVVQVTVLGLVYPCVNHGDGSWSLAADVLPALPFGNTTAYVQAVDAAGNVGYASGNIYVFDPSLLFAAGEQGFWYDPNDLTTLFQDSAGTIPVTAAGHLVGLMLDKSRGLALGVELLTNGGFTSDTGWSKGAGWTIAGDTLNAAGVAAFSTVTQLHPFVTGRIYEITYTILSMTSGSVRVSLFGGTQRNGTGRSSAGTYTERFVASGNTFVGVQATTVFSGIIDNISVRELAGNHVSFGDGATRPMLQYNATTGYHYLVPDGVDDVGVTASIDFTGTDSVSVFAGVRKLTSDTLTGSLLELSANSTNTAGSFGIFAGIGSGASYQFRGGGTIPGSAAGTGPGEFPAPHSAVIVGVGDISADTSQISINGVLEGVSATDQGTGNYGNHPLYLFRRGGTSLPFNGHFYGLCGVGRLTTAAEIANIKRILAQRTDVTLP